MNLAFAQCDLKVVRKKFTTKCSTHTEGLLRSFGGTRKFPGILKMLAIFMYLLSLIFLSRSIVPPLTAAKAEQFYITASHTAFATLLYCGQMC